jgi:hypothetical protein
MRPLDQGELRSNVGAQLTRKSSHCRSVGCAWQMRHANRRLKLRVRAIVNNPSLLCRVIGGMPFSIRC